MSANAPIIGSGWPSLLESDAALHLGTEALNQFQPKQHTQSKDSNNGDGLICRHRSFSDLDQILGISRIDAGASRTPTRRSTMTYLKLTAATLVMVALTACTGPTGPQGNYGNPSMMESGYTGRSGHQGTTGNTGPNEGPFSTSGMPMSTR